MINHMVKESVPSLDRTFAALADPTRRAILSRLAQGTATMGELAAPFDISLPAVSKHVGVLENAGLVVRKKEGRRRRCYLNATPLMEAAAWITVYERFWEGQLAALAEFIEQKKESED